MAGARDCTADTCPVLGGFVSYQPSLVGSAFMLAAFSLLVPVNIVVGWRFKSPLCAAAVTVGLLFEILGYAGRVLLRADLASQEDFSILTAGTIMGPIFMGAAISLTLPHTMVVFGSSFSLSSRPIYFNLLFLALDLFTFAFQAVGVSFAVNGRAQVEISQGNNILLVGLSMQLASLVLFLALYWRFRHRLARRRHVLDPTHSDVYLSRRFSSFCVGMQLAAGLLLIRTAVRVVQFSGGMASTLAQSEVAVLVLDGAVVLVTCIILTAMPAGAAFGSAWGPTSPFARRNSPATRHLQPSQMAGSGARQGISAPYSSDFVTPYFPSPPTSAYRRPRPPPIPPPRSLPVEPTTLRTAPYEMFARPVVPYLAPDGTPLPSLSPRSTMRRGEGKTLVTGDSLW